MQFTRYLLLSLIGLSLINPSPSWGDKVKEAMQSAARNYYRHAMMLGTDGKDAEAVRALQQAVGCDADFYEAYSMMGSSLDRLGRYGEAEEALRRAIQINPNYAEGYYYLGIFLKNRGRTQEAEQAFQKARQLQR
ncbi:MAG: tetratricopeptide repeat protein [Deltaproteobacteria bacterium]|nr:tetratricopeptide repeat protein [Deltaproteobacteria bacterium]MBW1952730.1 tetratricopeptide repeat protein [Deltaproteobacteria bacterium]MBW1986363.1 tetratricopeptide repeat protein [Deltaproteobacteria bacterium]MBW2133756.1 tetratricopeptide repeat protein [Deltaproteobacteria bacterium]